MIAARIVSAVKSRREVADGQVEPDLVGDDAGQQQQRRR